MKRKADQAAQEERKVAQQVFGANLHNLANDYYHDLDIKPDEGDVSLEPLESRHQQIVAQVRDLQLKALVMMDVLTGVLDAALQSALQSGVESMQVEVDDIREERCRRRRFLRMVPFFCQGS